jgi:gluconate 2-dehydrogenase alpha chain
MVKRWLALGLTGRGQARRPRSLWNVGNDPKTSVVNRYGQSWDVPNLFIVGSSTFPTMSGFNPTLTIQALAYMCADAFVNRYRNKPGSFV